MKMSYDYLIVGAGLFGAVCAQRLTEAGKKCLVVDRRKHIAGNCYSEIVEGVEVHKYGPHVFHTNDEGVWQYREPEAGRPHRRAPQFGGAGDLFGGVRYL